MINFFQEIGSLFIDKPAEMIFVSASFALLGGVVTNYFNKRSIINFVILVLSLLFLVDQIGVVPNFELDALAQWAVVMSIAGSFIERGIETGYLTPEIAIQLIEAIIKRNINKK